MPELRYLSDVVTLELDRGKCTGCSMCIEVCPHGVFILNEKKAEIIDHNACIECGACVMNCPAGALSVDSGPGCATAVLYSMAKGEKGENPSCCCSGESSCCS